MRAERDYRRRGSMQEVKLSMSITEFRETVEWLETVDPHDGATRDWRDELNRIDPQGTEA